MSDNKQLPDRIDQQIEPEHRTWLDTQEHRPVIVRYHNTDDVIVDTQRLLLVYNTEYDGTIITDIAEPTYDPERHT